MGTTISANNMVLGRSIRNNVYITTVPIGFHKSIVGIDTIEYSIREWNDKQILGNPYIGDFGIQIPAGLKFVITDVNKIWSIDAGTNVGTSCIILNDIPINENSLVAESVVNDRYESVFGNWSYCTAKSSTNKLLKSLMNKDKTMLKIKNIKCNVWTSNFFTQDGKDRFLSKPDFDKPLLTNNLITKYGVTEDNSNYLNNWVETVIKYF